MSTTSAFYEPRTAVLADMMYDLAIRPGQKLLVVGCGTGREAALLADSLAVDTVGIDITNRFDAAAGRRVRLELGDATKLRFESGSFDAVYSYHALEHIADADAALAEMRRVLKPGGRYCIGTPNRSRLVGYLGGGASWKERVTWNLADYKMRLQGRFRNEFGAHAGFTAVELNALLTEHFSSAQDVTLEYYRRLYSRSKAVLNGLVRAKMGRFVFPSVYFTGHSG